MHIFEVILCLFICIYAMHCAVYIYKRSSFTFPSWHNLQHAIASSNNLHIFNWLDHLSVLFVVEFGLQSHTYFNIALLFSKECAKNCLILMCVFHSLCGIWSLCNVNGTVHFRCCLLSMKCRREKIHCNLRVAQ